RAEQAHDDHGRDQHAPDDRAHDDRAPDDRAHDDHGPGDQTHDDHGPGDQTHDDHGPGDQTHDDHAPDEVRRGGERGRVVLSAAAAARAGIEAAVAGPRTIETRLRLNGRIVPNEDRLAHVLPRFAGIVREARKRIGDPVAQGEVMAVVQSNQSLQTYEIRSELAGTVIEKHVTPGEFAAEGDHLYTVANLDTVWVDLDVYRADFRRVAVGQPVLLDAGEGVAKAEARIDYISPFGSANTQTMLARVILPNAGLAWRPGFFVAGEVVLERTEVPVGVHAAAVQTIDGASVVFVQDGGAYEARPVVLGRRDEAFVEVRSGLEPGERYVARNSFVLKADVGKAGAQHEH
ncbi:MAG: HlyD family efflux transporter periplasmic adaptor subunit, partial [Deltaproteobacteria bacterium]|nr:HlyD family efflux transporter periplasmic adaptor subunit [Deltaproteobacteria bacterium]